MNKTVTRKQHYVPCAYLARFSPDFGREPRKRRILRTDDNIENVPVTCESQCYREFFYAASDTQRIESALQETENELQRITSNALGGVPIKQDLMLLILHHAIMFSRGVAVSNVSGESGYDAFEKTAGRLLENLFYDQPVENIYDKKFANYLFSNYGSLVLTSKSESLVTSDNPVIVFTTDKQSHAALSLMPLTAHKLSVVYNKRFVQAKQTTLSNDDVGYLNAFQAIHSHEAIFTFDELTESNVISARENFEHRQNPKVIHEGDRTGFRLPLVAAVEGELSFVRRVTTTA